MVHSVGQLVEAARLIGGPVGAAPFFGPKKSKMTNKAQNRNFLTLINR